MHVMRIMSYYKRAIAEIRNFTYNLRVHHTFVAAVFIGK
jgi:hypothetical protein